MKDEVRVTETVSKLFQPVIDLAQSCAEPWLTYALAFSAIALALSALLKIADDGTSFRAQSELDGPTPECLNFKVDQQAIDRLRDPSIPPVGKKLADDLDQERWLQSAVIGRTRKHQLHTTRPWRDAIEHDGLLYEYSDNSLHDEPSLREFAALGYEVKSLQSVNLPEFQGLRSEEYHGQLGRVWSVLPRCDLAVKTMSASRAQLARFTQTLVKLQLLRLKVETIPVWALLQQHDGEFFIPHLPQLKSEIFPSNLHLDLISRDQEFPAHLFGPKDGLEDFCQLTFQFQLASFYWRLITGEWPYDREPLLLLRGSIVNRVPQELGECLTPVLWRMTSLEPQERYECLGLALEDLDAAFAQETEFTRES